MYGKAVKGVDRRLGPLPDIADQIEKVSSQTKKVALIGAELEVLVKLKELSESGELSTGKDAIQALLEE